MRAVLCSVLVVACATLARAAERGPFAALLARRVPAAAQGRVRLAASVVTENPSLPRANFSRVEGPKEGGEGGGFWSLELALPSTHASPPEEAAEAFFSVAHKALAAAKGAGSAPKEALDAALAAALPQAEAAANRTVLECTACLTALAVGGPLVWDYGIYYAALGACSLFKLSEQACSDLLWDAVDFGIATVWWLLWPMVRLTRRQWKTRTAASLGDSVCFDACGLRGCCAKFRCGLRGSLSFDLLGLTMFFHAG